MSNIKYSISESIVSYDGFTQVTYGISVQETSSPGLPIVCIHDITSNKSSLEQLVNLCNRKNLSLIHLNDIIEDFLCQ